MTTKFEKENCMKCKYFNKRKQPPCQFPTKQGFPPCLVKKAKVN